MLQPIATQIHRLLIKNKKTLAIAESCTGGLLSGLLTRLPGSSQYFTSGIVAYSNKAKTDILKIPKGIIIKKGAVSKEVASLMAKSARTLAKTDFCIGITGIAGPSGGSKEKPVGTVFIALESKNKKSCQEFHFLGSRTNIRKKAALKSLVLLKKLL